MASLPDVASQDSNLGFTRGLMKTWHFPNFWQILLGCHLTQASWDPKKKDEKERQMTCSHQTGRWKVLPEKQKPSEQTSTLLHWAWAHDHCSYWKTLTSTGSVPTSSLLLWRGPMYFSWHSILNMEGGGVTSRYIKNHIMLSLMPTAHISVMVLLISNPSLPNSPMQYHFLLPIGSHWSLLQRDLPSWEAFWGRGEWFAIFHLLGKQLTWY